MQKIDATIIIIIHVKNDDEYHDYYYYCYYDKITTYCVNILTTLCPFTIHEFIVTVFQLYEVVEFRSLLH